MCMLYIYIYMYIGEAMGYLLKMELEGTAGVEKTSADHREWDKVQESRNYEGIKYKSQEIYQV